MPPTPVFVNDSAGGAGAVLRVLRADPRVEVRTVPPARLAAEIGAAVERNLGSRKEAC